MKNEKTGVRSRGTSCSSWWISVRVACCAIKIGTVGPLRHSWNRLLSDPLPRRDLPPISFMVLFEWWNLEPFQKKLVCFICRGTWWKRDLVRAQTGSSPRDQAEFHHGEFTLAVCGWVWYIDQVEVEPEAYKRNVYLYIYLDSISKLLCLTLIHAKVSSMRKKYGRTQSCIILFHCLLYSIAMHDVWQCFCCFITDFYGFCTGSSDGQGMSGCRVTSGCFGPWACLTPWAPSQTLEAANQHVRVAWPHWNGMDTNPEKS